MSRLGDRANEAYCYLSTTGRRSGRPHRIEIWFATDGERLYLLSGGGDRSDWVRNLLADPSAAVRVGGDTWRCTGRVVTDPEEELAARRLLAAKYQGWRPGTPLSGWAAAALPVALELSDT